MLQRDVKCEVGGTMGWVCECVERGSDRCIEGCDGLKEEFKVDMWVGSECVERGCEGYIIYIYII